MARALSVFLEPAFISLMRFTTNSTRRLTPLRGLGSLLKRGRAAFLQQAAQPGANPCAALPNQIQTCLIRERGVPAPHRHVVFQKSVGLVLEAGSCGHAGQ